MEKCLKRYGKKQAYPKVFHTHLPKNIVPLFSFSTHILLKKFRFIINMFYIDRSALVRSCESLELRPTENDRSSVSAYVWECGQEDTSAKDREEYISQLLGNISLGGRNYEPYCKKKYCPCVVLESAAISQHYHGLGKFYQPIIFTISNSRKMESCKDRQIPENSIDGMEPLDAFLLRHIQE